MLTMNDLDPLLGHRSTVVTHQGDKVGSIGEVYLDDATDEPAWITVHTGLFGTKESFVPLRDAAVQGDSLVVAFPRELIRHAPSVDRDGHLTPDDEAALYRHYDLAGAAPADSEASPFAGAPADTEAGADTPVRKARDDDGEPWMVRSEERLRVGTERYEAARVRLRKYVVTEDATVTVPLRREELRVEVEPITTATLDGSEDGSLFREESVEIVLREEQAVVRKETVEVERVRMQKAAVAGRATVREEVRKERISSSIDGEEPAGGADPGVHRSGRGRVSTRATGAEGEQSSKIVTGSPNALLKGRSKRR